MQDKFWAQKCNKAFILNVKACIHINLGFTNNLTLLKVTKAKAIRAKGSAPRFFSLSLSLSLVYFSPTLSPVFAEAKVKVPARGKIKFFPKLLFRIILKCTNYCIAGHQILPNSCIPCRFNNFVQTYTFHSKIQTVTKNPLIIWKSHKNSPGWNKVFPKLPALHTEMYKLWGITGHQAMAFNYLLCKFDSFLHTYTRHVKMLAFFTKIYLSSEKVIKTAWGKIKFFQNSFWVPYWNVQIVRLNCKKHCYQTLLHCADFITLCRFTLSCQKYRIFTKIHLSTKSKKNQPRVRLSFSKTPYWVHT